MDHDLTISDVDVTTIALPTVGARFHSDGRAPYLQIKHILRVTTRNGVTGLGEVGPRVSGQQLMDIGRGLIGEDAFQFERIQRRVRSVKFYRMELAVAAAGFEMACLDIVGRSINRPISALLGGRLRDSVPVIGYLYRRDGGANEPGVACDEVVTAAEAMYQEYGFQTWKLKAAAAAVDDDIEVMRVLRERFPHHKLRIDPNGAWGLATAIVAARYLAALNVEWIEDPVLGIEGMASFAHRGGIPTATNMCCIEPSQFPLAVRLHAMDVMLLDLWYLGGPWSARYMGSMCQAFGIGVGVHAGGGNPEAGIGLAAQLHLASSLPSMVHAADTAYFELADDILEGARLRCVDGYMPVPEGPGLGVNIDEDALGRAAERFRHSREVGEPPRIFPSYPLF